MLLFLLLRLVVHDGDEVPDRLIASESFAELECRVPVKHPARRNLGRLDATATAIQVGAASRRGDRLRSQRSFYCVDSVVRRGDNVRVVLAEV